MTSIDPYKSLPFRQAGVIQTIYDIVKAHVGELKMESEKEMGAFFTVLLLMKNLVEFFKLSIGVSVILVFLVFGNSI